MKSRLFLASVALASVFSQMTSARDHNRFRTWSSSARRSKSVLIAVKMMGTLRCENRDTATEYGKDHVCDLEFVNDESGEAWSLKSNPNLTTIHHNGRSESKAHIDAMRSPRFLLGGSYIEVKNIETRPSELANVDFDGEPDFEPNHPCSLDPNWGKGR